MLTFKLWRALNVPPTYRQVIKRLLPDKMPPRGLTIEPMVSLVVLCACATFPFLGIPLILHLSAVRLTLHITNVIAKWHELRRRDLLAITPIGELTLLFEVCRAYFHPEPAADSSDSDTNFRRTLLALAAVVGLIIAPILLLTLRDTEESLFPIVVMFVSPTIVVGAVAWEYRQSFVMGTLIALLSATAGDRTMARVWMLGSYFVLQLSLYVLLMLKVGVMGALNLTLRNGLGEVGALIVSVGIPLGVLFGAREALVWLLWRRLRGRVNEDAAQLKLEVIKATTPVSSRLN
jgi:hypothetical protein